MYALPGAGWQRNFCMASELNHENTKHGSGDRHADELHRCPRCAANQTWLPDCRVPSDRRLWCIVPFHCRVWCIVCAASCVMRGAWRALLRRVCCTQARYAARVVCKPCHCTLLITEKAGQLSGSYTWGLTAAHATKHRATWSKQTKRAPPRGAAA